MKNGVAEDEGPAAVPAEPEKAESFSGRVAQEDSQQQLRLVGEGGESAQQPAAAFRTHKINIFSSEGHVINEHNSYNSLTALMWLTLSNSECHK